MYPSCPLHCMSSRKKYLLERMEDSGRGEHYVLHIPEKGVIKSNVHNPSDASKYTEHLENTGAAQFVSRKESNRILRPCVH